MSRGPGVIMREIVKAIHDQPIAEDGVPGRLTYRELAQLAYGVAAPTASQRESVARACRRLVEDGSAERWLEGRRVEQERWTNGMKCRPMTVYEGAVTRPVTDEERAAYDRHRDLAFARLPGR